MKSTRRTFFAAIGAAVLGKYAVKFWPELVTHTSVDVLPAWEPAAPNAGLFGLQYYQISGNAGMFMGIPRSAYPGSPRMNAMITNIGVPRRLSMNEALSDFDTAWDKMNAACIRTNFDPARLPA